MTLLFVITVVLVEVAPLVSFRVLTIPFSVNFVVIVPISRISVKEPSELKVSSLLIKSYSGAEKPLILLFSKVKNLYLPRNIER